MNKYKQHHMSKSELKTNKILDFAVKFRHFFIKNKTNFLRGSIVAIILLILVAVLMNNKSKKEEQASVLFENAYSIIRNPKLINTKINDADKFLTQVVRKFPSTFAAAKAHFYIGNIKYKLRNFKLALAHFNKAVAYGSGTYIYPASLLAAGDASSQMNKIPAAINYYNRVISDSHNSGLKGSALMKKFYCLMKMKNFKLASLTLNEIKKSGSLWTGNADKWDAYIQLFRRKKISKNPGKLNK